MPELPPDLLSHVSSWSTPVIAGFGVFHLLVFFYLMAWARRDLRRLAHDFDAFTRDMKHRSVLDRSGDLSDQIDAFLADIRDVLDDPAKHAERKALAQRMQILDEERRYLQSLRFETWYTVARTMIEAYPLAGVMGTVFAIGAAMQTQPDGGEGSVSAIVKYFGHSIWTTFAGLIAAVVLMFVNSVVETRFRRLSECRTHVRDTVARAKRELSLTTTGAATP